MIWYVSLIAVLIAFLASFVLYFQGPSDIYLRLFPIYLFLLSILLAIESYQSAKQINSTQIFNALTILQYCFYFFMLNRIIKNRFVKLVALNFIWIYPVVSLLNILFVQKTNVHTITYAIGALLMVAFCIFYFFELFQQPQSVPLARSPDFWICSGLLFYFSCSFPIYGMANNIQNLPHFILGNLVTILNVLDVLLYTSLVIAFICRPVIRKSLS